MGPLQNLFLVGTGIGTVEGDIAFGGKEYETDTMAYSAFTAGPVLQKVNSVFQELLPSLAVKLCQENTTTVGSSSLAAGRVYAYGPFDNLTDTYEYGLGSAPNITETTLGSYYQCAAPVPTGWTRHTQTSYVTDPNYVGTTTGAAPAPGPYLLALPASTTVTYGGATASQTYYFYDAQTDTSNNTGCSAGSQTSLLTSAAPNLASTAYPRGNATCVARQIGPSSWASTKRQYDTAGNVVNAWDANSNLTQYTYADNCSYGLLSGVVNALGQTASLAYDCGVAKVNSFTDANNRVTTLSYSDPFGRLTSALEAGIRQTSYTYNISPPSVDAVTAGVYSQIVYDDLGRKVSTLQCTATCSTGGPSRLVARTDTQYDFLGRVSAVSNPYDATSTPVWTTTTYDALSRVIAVTRPDSSQFVTAYDVSTAGLSAEVTDEAGKSRTTYTDGFGRLIQVIEDPNGLNYSTAYTYNGLDNLLNVSQGVQTRTFTYDMLGRLLTATNPESGVISYTYDLNGNLKTKTDARTGPNPTVTMQYDALNRVQSKQYASLTYTYPGSPPVTVTTPTVQFCYDGLVYSNGVCTANSASEPGDTAHEQGYLTSVGNANSYSQYAHQALGLVRWSQQVTNGQNYVFQANPAADGYQYDSGGRLTDLWYPTGRHLTYGYDGAMRPDLVGGYVTSVTYMPSGAPLQMVLANGVAENTSYNSRLQITAIEADMATTSLWKLENFYCTNQGSGCSTNNGNVISQRLTAPALAGGSQQMSTSYGYDGVNRLNSAGETVTGQSGTAGDWSCTFSADQFGNQWSTGATLGVDSFMPQDSTYFDTTTNRLARYGARGSSPPYGTVLQSVSNPHPYDSAGNLTDHPDLGQVVYDGENHVVQVTTGANVAQYAYDGEGRRIGKTASGVTTVYVYDAGGDLAAEYSQGGTPESGRRYLTADHLGSTRLVTNGSGGVRQRIDYFPFGQEIPASEAFGNRDQITGYADTVDIPHQSATQEFTGKERDAETGLDYFEARYMSSAQGRFTSPDPSNLSVDFWYPQSWNRYAYSLNNPLAVVDRNGLWPTWVHNEIINEAFPGLSKDQLQNLQTASKNVDSDQSLAGSYKHGMANGQDPNGTVHAEMDSDEFISNNLHDAKSIQAAWIASGHTGIAPGALTAFGNALHTITDKTSPSHQYFQPWYGMGLFDLPEAGYHFVREAWPWGGNQQRQQNAVDAARQYFLLTFGSDTAAQAETPKKPKVKSKICYQTDNGLVCQQ